MATLASQTEYNSENLLYCTNALDGKAQIAQTFTVPAGYKWTLSNIRIAAVETGSVSLITGEIVGTTTEGSDIIPDESDLKDTIIRTAVTGDLDFPFPTVLTAGTYAMVFTVSHSDGFDSLLLRSKEVSSPDPYAGGIACIEIDDGGWAKVEIEGAYHDLLFIISGVQEELYVFTPPEGGPTGKRLIACANNRFWYEDI
jgi:hypothetical protein